MAKKQKNTKLIHDLPDLIELVNHNTVVIERQIKKLAKSSRRSRILILIGVGYAVYAAIQCRKQEEELYRLSVRVNKLENKEGE